MYKAIIFDVYGTLFDMDSLKNEMIEFDTDTANSITKLWRKTQLRHMFMRQVMQRYIAFDELTKDALRHTLNVHDIQYNREDINRLFESFFNLNYYKEIPKSLSDLRDKNIDVGILSNGNDNMLMPLIDNSELSDYIDTLISVNEIKQYKPSSASYALVLEYYHMNREDILFVSSNSWDITGASNFGFDTAWVNRTNKKFDVNGPTPTITVSNVSEMNKWIELNNK